MRFQGYCLILLLCWLAFVSTGCISAAGGAHGDLPLPVTVLLTGRQCSASGNEWRGTWLTSPEALRQWMAACRSNIVAPRRDYVPGVDFSRFGVLAVEMGMRNSAGYGFDAAGVVGYSVGRTVTVTVNCYQPDPGAITAQVITSPFILIQIPMDDYDGIRVLDRDARPLVEIRCP